MKRFTLLSILLASMSVVGFGGRASASDPGRDVQGLDNAGVARPHVEKVTRSSGTEVTEARQNVSPLRTRPRMPFASSPLRMAPLNLESVRSSEEAPTIYGSLIFSQQWSLDVAAPGIYSFQAMEDSPITLVHEGYLTQANGSGTYANSRYYMYYWFEASGAVFTYWRVFDTDTWQALFSERTLEPYIATDLTYDPTTETIYGCYYHFRNQAYYFGKTNPDNGDVTILGYYNEPLFTLAADVNGDLYAITANGALNKVNKSNGQLTAIGNTGITPAYTQTMTFDMKTNKLYWAACTSTVNGLYEVDPTTGNATHITSFPYNEEFAGLYTMNQGAKANAPGELTEFSAEYDITTDTDIKVSFRMPTRSFSGGMLSGTLDWTVRVNDVDIEMGSAMPGAKVEYTVKGTSPGYAVITAHASNDAGAGPDSRERKWIGRDNPQAVKNLRGTMNGHDIHLTWEAPTESMHGGYFDTGALTYRVVRNPGNTIVCPSTTATSFSDHIDTDILTAYTYDVTAYANNLPSPVVTTAKMLVGNAFTPPYQENFSNSSCMELFTIIDANNDGKTWSWDDSAARGEYCFTSDMDDWLITPPIELKSTDLYSIGISARTFGYTERFEICIGTTPTVEGMSTVVVPAMDLLTSSYTPIKKDFLPTADGTYYVGIHHISKKGSSTLYVNNLEVVRLAAVTCPAIVENLRITPADKGALSATLTFDAPSKNLLGETLTQLNGVKIYKGNRIVKNLTGITPGQKNLTWTDNSCEHGENTYRLVASNNDGEGRETTISAYIGPDIPGPSNNIRLRYEDGKAHLTWDAPDRGVNGGYIDPDNLRYHIAGQNFENGGTNALAQNLTEREFWDTPTVAKPQGMAAYYVYAVNDQGIGYGYRSNVLIMGTPYELTFKESFAGNNPTYSTWRFETSKGECNWGIADSGTYPACGPADNDGGMITLEPKMEGSVTMLISGLIDISKADVPVYEFSYFYNRLGGDKIEACVSTDGYEFTSLKEVDMGQESGSSGWRRLSVPLAAYKEAGTIQIGIRVETGTDLANVHFDNITVRDQPERDLAVTGFTTPRNYTMGQSGNFTVTVTNQGQQTADTYRVVLMRDGEDVQSQTGNNLKADASATFTFTDTPDQSYGSRCQYSARVVFEGDRQPVNNEWIPTTVYITQPSYASVTDLRGNLDDNTGEATLSWSEPDFRSGTREADSFESYSSFLINGIGDWQTVDRDNNYTVFVENAVMWPHAGDPQAFIVFNAEDAGLDAPYTDGTPSMFLAHEGKQMLISFSSDEGANDDWLVSPRLNGKEQEISFYVKSLTDYYGKEKWEFWTSTGEFRENLGEFTRMKDEGGEASEEWECITITVPEGTTYFAIRCVSNGAFGFCVDDITYQSAAIDVTLKGYHVYCNDERLTAEPITATSYVHKGVSSDKSYRYNVVCVYDKGESIYSNDLNLGLVSISDVAQDGIRIYSEGGAVHILGATGERWGVYSADGRQVAGGVASDKESVELEQGIYVVQAGKSARKVVL